MMHPISIVFVVLLSHHSLGLEISSLFEYLDINIPSHQLCVVVDIIICFRSIFSSFSLNDNRYFHITTLYTAENAFKNEQTTATFEHKPSKTTPVTSKLFTTLTGSKSNLCDIYWSRSRILSFTGRSCIYQFYYPDHFDLQLQGGGLNFFLFGEPDTCWLFLLHSLVRSQNSGSKISPYKQYKVEPTTKGEGNNNPYYYDKLSIYS